MAKEIKPVNITGLNRREQGFSPTFTDFVSEDNQFKEIPLDKIIRNPNQPRQFFNEEKLNELAESIRQKGVIQPIIVKPDPENQRYILIAGERRYRAAKIAERETIPALVKEKEDPLELGIIENLQREDLNPIEEAEAIMRLKEERGYSDGQVAQILGTSRPSINMTLKLNALPEQIKKACQHVDTPPKTLLYEIARLESEEEQLRAWDRYKRGELSIVQSRQEQSKKNLGDRPKPYEYKRKCNEGNYTISIRFRKFEVNEEEIIEVLENELYHMRNRFNHAGDVLG
jgi:ParB family chromosome partitioning protein